MALLANTMVKLNKAGATDLPWCFELYHIAWFVFFPAMWYFFGITIAIIIFFIVCATVITLA
jgi:hypothetical protein